MFGQEVAYDTARTYKDVCLFAARVMFDSLQQRSMPALFIAIRNYVSQGETSMLVGRRGGW